MHEKSPPPIASPPIAATKTKPRKRHDEVGLLPVLTLVLWTTCLAIGLIGWQGVIPAYPPAPTSAPALETVMLNVQITDDPPPDQDIAADDQPANDPAPMTPLPAPPVVPAAAVAAPSPMIAFAEPIEGPVHIVSQTQAVPTRPPAQNPQATNAIVAAPPVTQLVLGQGEGRQSKPEYPGEARMAHQQGTVVVRFDVAPDGSVSSVELAQPSAFPLLNQAALRAVRDEWRFPTGPPRRYEVAIKFSLRQE